MPEEKPGNDPDSLEELARRYVDLWQDQMTALAADPAFAESLQKVMASMGVAASGLPALWSAWPAAMNSLMAAAGSPGDIEGQKSHDARAGDVRKDRGGATAPRAAAPAASPHGGGTDLGVLEERLAALEQRVLALEGGSGRTRSSAKRKSKRS